MKKIVAIMFAFALIISSGGVSYAKGNEDKIKLTTEEEKQLFENLTDLGIEAKTQKELVKKWKKGIMWDSMNREKVKAVPEELLTATREEPVKSYTFPDGSVIKNVLEEIDREEIPVVTSGQISVMAAEGFRTNYQVWTSTGVITASFRVDFNIRYGAADYIDSVYNKYIMVIGGTYANAVLAVKRYTEDTANNRPAWASLDFTVQPLGVFGSFDCYMRFYVEDNTYYKKALT